jgi:thioredoxin reductase
MFDAIIVGGSTAGLSAALYLGRFRRNVLIIDSQKPANRFSHASHGFFTRDGVSPTELVAIGREQLAKYETITFQVGEVTQIQPEQQHFAVTLADGSRYSARKILLATGMKDTLSAINGLQQFWGISVFHCPFCDGWEQRDQPVAILNRGEAAFHHAKLLRVLTADLVICSDGPSELTAEQQAWLTKYGIQLIETAVERVEGQGTQVEQIVFVDGSTLARTAIFTRLNVAQPSDFAAQLGYELTPNGLVKVDAQGRTTIVGIYAAGDMTYGARQIVYAASQGAATAIGMIVDLIAEDFPD